MKLSSNFALILLILTGCCGSDSSDDLSNLKIDREAPVNIDVVEHEDGTITKVFSLLRQEFEWLAFRSRGNEMAPDPFAAPVKQDRRISGAIWSARKLLESFDIPFPGGSESDAVYDLNAGILTVRHEPEWVDFIEVILDLSGSQESREQLINLRVEIYQAPKALALRLDQSAGEHKDHQPEWETLQKIVREGDATFVTSCNVRSVSGQRAQYQDGIEQILFSGFELNETKNPPLPEPVFGSRTVGTIVEFDPVLGADNVTVDLNFLLEHHTAPPTMALLEIPVPGTEELVSIEAPVFHSKKLVTLLTIGDGGTRLLCSWRPTGLPEFEGRDLMRIAFLRVDVQRSSRKFD